MINYQSKTKEELIIEIQRLQHEHNSLEGNFNRVINERKLSEKSLRRKEEQMRSIFEAMNEGFTIQEVVCDDAGKPCDLRFIEANTAFERQTGLKKVNTLGHTLLELFPQSESYWIERYGNVGLTGEPIHFETMLGPQDIYYKINAFQTEYGRLGVMYTEITGRMLADQELLLAQEHADESDRLKSEILANMSHDIRTPMNGILGFTELLKEPNLTEEEQQKYISIIEESGTRMLHIINDIVDNSKAEFGNSNETIPNDGRKEEKNITGNDVFIDNNANKTHHEVSGLKILIAEDDDASGTLISIVVKRYGKEIIKVRTGVEAVETCRNNADIDLVLMDIQMPEMDGYEATRQIRQFNKDVIIIAQTAFGLTGDREKSIQAGCNDYISKPIGKDKLQALIQEHFNK
jgi:CheY-like chemotaxis protein/PAS domain-containing protein